MISDLLKSKRLWVTVLTLVIHLLAKYHVVISDAAIADMADQLVLAMGAVGLLVTKVMDSRKVRQAS